MKLSHLSLAIFSAISLAACGGSNNNAVDNAVVPKPETDKVEPVKPEQVVVDPTKTGVVGALDFKKESSIGGTQYIRNKNSQFDRNNNPKESTVATAIFGVNVDEQNPYLTNIALARLQDKSVPNKTLVQYLGNDATTAADIFAKTSLQQQNKHNVSLPFESSLTKKADLVSLNRVSQELDAVKQLIEKYNEQATLSADAKINLKDLQKVETQLQTLKDQMEKNENIGVGAYALLPYLKNSYAYAWGDGIKTSDRVLNQSDVDIFQTNQQGNLQLISGSYPLSLGLVGIGYEKGQNYPDHKFKGDNAHFIQGTEERSESSTRIFGRNNLDIFDDVSDFNSYLGADKIVHQPCDTPSSVGSCVNFPTLQSLAEDSVNKNYTFKQINDYINDARDLSSQYYADAYVLRSGVQWSVGVIPTKLEYVQYGRVTGNLDPVGFTAEDKKSLDKHIFKPAKFLTKGSDKSVDTYFYRGVDPTSISQMQNLSTQGKALTYKGHALMYGIDNNFHGKTTEAIPTAFGKANSYGVGNFVEAEVDLSKARLQKGIVYNVWKKHDLVDQQWTNSAGSLDLAKDVLVYFDGNIVGNTVLGEAQRSYNTSDKADFRGSFYGDNAQELAGSFNSTTYQERYGAKGDVWGGVFGASKTTETSSLSNAQLGDIPMLTTPETK